MVEVQELAFRYITIEAQTLRYATGKINVILEQEGIGTLTMAQVAILNEAEAIIYNLDSMRATVNSDDPTK